MIVSIIMPVYNKEKYLDKSIKSILNQTYKNFELIIINDGSTDNSSCICHKFEQEDIRIKVIDIENNGVSNARNIGLKMLMENMYSLLMGMTILMKICY